MGVTTTRGRCPAKVDRIAMLPVATAASPLNPRSDVNAIDPEKRRPRGPPPAPDDVVTVPSPAVLDRGQKAAAIPKGRAGEVERRSL
jgi:hypothetical protein